MKTRVSLRYFLADWRSTADQENSEVSDSGEDDEENDRRNRVTIHETDYRVYNETNLAAFFLSHQDTSTSSVTAAGKSQHDPIDGLSLQRIIWILSSNQWKLGELTSE